MDTFTPSIAFPAPPTSSLPGGVVDVYSFKGNTVFRVPSNGFPTYRALWTDFTSSTETERKIGCSSERHICRCLYHTGIPGCVETVHAVNGEFGKPDHDGNCHVQYISERVKLYSIDGSFIPGQIANLDKMMAMYTELDKLCKEKNPPRSPRRFSRDGSKDFIDKDSLEGKGEKGCCSLSK